jgi:hypothetical protein
LAKSALLGGSSAEQVKIPLIYEMTRAIVLTACEETVKYPQ